MEYPWLKFYGHIPKSIDYPDLSMFAFVEETAKRHPNIIAYEYMGKSVNYKNFIQRVELCARALMAYGISKEDKVTVCMPNCPQAVIMFYALNKIGAVANMTHPLSAQNEIAHFVLFSQSKAILIPDMFYHKIKAVEDRLENLLVIVTGMADELSAFKRTALKLANTGKFEKPIYKERVISWRSFLKAGKKGKAEPGEGGADTVAAILYSGGTTGTTKGIMLTNLNFNACALGTAALGDCITVGNKMLAIMPVFHGFGLGVCVHTALAAGGTSILVPRFTPAGFVKLIKKHRPNYIAGVPTLYEAMLRIDKSAELDLSCLEGVFCGGDSLSPELKDRMDSFLHSHGSKEQIREGYGTTECVTASCLTPRYENRRGSIGIPFPDMLYKIVRPNTDEELGFNEVGEITMRGPLVMKGYLNNAEETEKTLKVHSDGEAWLHTGDLGYMDSDGFVYFKQRLKRVIITSGFNVYPSQIESLLDSHEAVRMSCVIGVRDDYKIQRIKAFIALKQGYTESEELLASIKNHCVKNLAKYAIPKEFEFRSELPTTLVGKVAYRILEEEEEKKWKQSE